MRKKNDFYSFHAQFSRYRTRKTKICPSFYKNYTSYQKKAVNFANSKTLI